MTVTERPASDARDKPLSELLLAHEEALAAGSPQQADLAALREEDLGLLRLLHNAWPRPGGPENTPTVPQPPAPSDPGDIPRLFGRFHVIRVLGRGGCGVVYLAFDPTVRRQVALKVPQ